MKKISLKNLIWRLILKKGWYQVTWNNGAFNIKDRLFWDGKHFRRISGGKTQADYDSLSIFVKRLSP